MWKKSETMPFLQNDVWIGNLRFIKMQKSFQFFRTLRHRYIQEIRSFSDRFKVKYCPGMFVMYTFFVIEFHEFSSSNKLTAVKVLCNLCMCIEWIKQNGLTLGITSLLCGTLFTLISQLYQDTNTIRKIPFYPTVYNLCPINYIKQTFQSSKRPIDCQVIEVPFFI